jgi:hypothetical protein
MLPLPLLVARPTRARAHFLGALLGAVLGALSLTACRDNDGDGEGDGDGATKPAKERRKPKAALATGAPKASPKPLAPVRWKAVLMTGDDSIPAFDNARHAFRKVLVKSGVKPGDIRELTMSLKQQIGKTGQSDVAGLRRALKALKVKDGEGCLVYLTSHGAPWGFYIRDRDSLTPTALAAMLDQSCGKRPTAVFVSACYSGIFTGNALKAPNRVVFTAARDDRNSFGCGVDHEYTFWDGCLLDEYASAAGWEDLDQRLKACIRKKERRERVRFSYPQLALGDRVKRQPLPRRMTSAEDDRAWRTAGTSLRLTPQPHCPVGDPPDSSRALLAAAAQGRSRAFEKLAKAPGADRFARDADGRTALMLAALSGSLPTMRRVLALGTDIDARDLNGRTALHLVADKDVAATALLLGAGAAPRLYDRMCLTPLDIASLAGERYGFALLRAPTSRAPLPNDGTVEECLPKKKVVALEPTALAARKRLLTIDDVEDYEGAYMTLSRMAPATAQELAKELLAVVDHATPPRAEERPQVASAVREMALRALDLAGKRRPAIRRKVQAAMQRIVAEGSCDAFTKRACTDEVVEECKSDDLVERGLAAGRKILFGERPEAEPFPREPAQELCYTCQYCGESRHGQAYRLATDWLKKNKVKKGGLAE